MFGLTSMEMKKIIKDFHSEMAKGLSGKKSSLKMIPSFVEGPRGTEKGTFLALDLGGTNFRVMALKLNGHGNISKLFLESIVLQKKYITGTGTKFFDFLAASVKSFVKKYSLDISAGLNVGFTFSFPVKQTSINSGILIHWTKGFEAYDVEGKDVVRLLNESLARNGLAGMKVVALANDTVSTLIAKAYEDQNCSMGVILGTGTNACYSEKVSKILKSKGLKTRSGKMVVNIEWGNFNKLHSTSYDKKLDKESDNPGKQILEKMVSGMYMGELTRLVTKDLIRQKNIFTTNNLVAFNKPRTFKSEYMSIIQGDSSKNLIHADGMLKKLGILNSSYADRVLLKKICAIVSTRAARISAVAMASVITKIDPALSRKHTVAIDGSVYEKYPGFSDKIKETLRIIFKNKSRRIKLSLAKDGSSIGAGILAAV